MWPYKSLFRDKETEHEPKNLSVKKPLSLEAEEGHILSLMIVKPEPTPTIGKWTLELNKHLQHNGNMQENHALSISMAIVS